MDYSEFLGKNVVIGEDGLLENRKEDIVIDTSAIEAAISINLAEEKTKRLMEARKQIALENIAANRLPEWLNLEAVDLASFEVDEVVYEGERIIEQ